MCIWKKYFFSLGISLGIHRTPIWGKYVKNLFLLLPGSPDKGASVLRGCSNISTNKYDILILPDTLFNCSIPSFRGKTIAVLFIGVIACSRNTENTRTFGRTSSSNIWEFFSTGILIIHPFGSKYRNRLYASYRIASENEHGMSNLIWRRNYVCIFLQPSKNIFSGEIPKMAIPLLWPPCIIFPHSSLLVEKGVSDPYSSQTTHDDSYNHLPLLEMQLIMETFGAAKTARSILVGVGTADEQNLFEAVHIHLQVSHHLTKMKK